LIRPLSTRRAAAAASLAAVSLAADFLVAAAILLAGCRAERAGVPPAASRAPARLVTLAPSLTETAYALGLGDRVVGVSDYSAWPPEAAAKTRLGGLFNPDLERIVGLKPDLALLLPSQRDLAARLGALGIASRIVPSESLADVERSFVEIGDCCGRAAAGRELAARFHAALAPRPAAVIGGGSGGRGGRRLGVLLAVGRDPGRLGNVLAAGPGTFLDELLARLGGRNVFADAPVRYPQVGLEEVVARAPDAILELENDPLPEARKSRLIADWRSLPRVPAVARGQVSVIAGNYVLIPGPRLPRLYDEMAAALRRAAAGMAGGASGKLGE
jgi:iron complex transport system substrate-binding protein